MGSIHPSDGKTTPHHAAATTMLPWRNNVCLMMRFKPDSVLSDEKVAFGLSRPRHLLHVYGTNFKWSPILTQRKAYFFLGYFSKNPNSIKGAAYSGAGPPYTPPPPALKRSSPLPSVLRLSSLLLLWFMPCLSSLWVLVDNRLLAVLLWCRILSFLQQQMLWSPWGVWVWDVLFVITHTDLYFATSLQGVSGVKTALRGVDSGAFRAERLRSSDRVEEWWHRG